MAERYHQKTTSPPDSIEDKKVMNQPRQSPLTKTPKKSGVYFTICKCGKEYVGETSLKVFESFHYNGTSQKDDMYDEKWDLTGISSILKSALR